MNVAADAMATATIASDTVRASPPIAQAAAPAHSNPATVAAAMAVANAARGIGSVGPVTISPGKNGPKDRRGGRIRRGVLRRQPGSGAARIAPAGLLALLPLRRADDPPEGDHEAQDQPHQQPDGAAATPAVNEPADPCPGQDREDKVQGDGPGLGHPGDAGHRPSGRLWAGGGTLEHLGDGSRVWRIRVEVPRPLLQFALQPLDPLVGLVAVAALGHGDAPPNAASCSRSGAPRRWHP